MVPVPDFLRQGVGGNEDTLNRNRGNPRKEGVMLLGRHRARKRRHQLVFVVLGGGGVGVFGWGGGGNFL